MSSKQISFLFFIFLILSMSLSPVSALEIIPSFFEVDLQIDGLNSTIVYFSSDGAVGELIIGKEDLPFRIEPSRINMSSDDVDVPIEVTFYGNRSLETGVYEGKITFLAYTGDFFAVGIKIGAKINFIDEFVNRTVSFVVDDQITIPESSSSELIEESQNNRVIFYFIGGAVGLGLGLAVIIWWRRRES